MHAVIRSTSPTSAEAAPMIPAIPGTVTSEANSQAPGQTGKTLLANLKGSGLEDQRPLVAQLQALLQHGFPGRRLPDRIQAAQDESLRLAPRAALQMKSVRAEAMPGCRIADIVRKQHCY